MREFHLAHVSKPSVFVRRSEVFLGYLIDGARVTVSSLGVISYERLQLRFHYTQMQMCEPSLHFPFTEHKGNALMICQWFGIDSCGLINTN